LDEPRSLLNQLSGFRRLFIKVENIEKPTTKFIATKLFWVGVVGTYILAGILLNRLETNASYEELRSSSLIPSIFYFFTLFLSYRSFKTQAVRTTILQFATQMLLLLPLMSMFMAVVLFTTKFSS
jgi:predicted ferric reductase